MSFLRRAQSCALLQAANVGMHHKQTVLVHGRIVLSCRQCSPGNAYSYHLLDGPECGVRLQTGLSECAAAAVYNAPD